MRFCTWYEVCPLIFRFFAMVSGISVLAINKFLETMPMNCISIRTHAEHSKMNSSSIKQAGKVSASCGAGDDFKNCHANHNKSSSVSGGSLYLAEAPFALSFKVISSCLDTLFVAQEELVEAVLVLRQWDFLEGALDSCFDIFKTLKSVAPDE